MNKNTTSKLKQFPQAHLRHRRLRLPERFEVLEGKAGGVKEGLVAVECVGIGATGR